MSDPVTNVEIEDVLSSIRRLVSADDREAPQHRQTAEAAPRPQEARLVLTPAQRVDEPEGDTATTDMDIEAPESRQQNARRFDGVEDAEIVEARGQGSDADAEILKDLPQFIRSGIRDQADAPQTTQDAETPAEPQTSEPDTGTDLTDDWDAADDDLSLSETDLPEEDEKPAEAVAADLDAAADDAADEIDLKEL
ncbi:hypothetical protein A3731_39975, partial [Roseovarius sp. HI0049]